MGVKFILKINGLKKTKKRVNKMLIAPINKNSFQDDALYGRLNGKGKG